MILSYALWGGPIFYGVLTTAFYNVFMWMASLLGHIRKLLLFILIGGLCVIVIKHMPLHISQVFRDDSVQYIDLLRWIVSIFTAEKTLSIIMLIACSILYFGLILRILKRAFVLLMNNAIKIFLTILLLASYVFPVSSIGHALLIGGSLMMCIFLCEIRGLLGAFKKKGTNTDWLEYARNSAIHFGKSQYVVNKASLFVQYIKILKDFIAKITEIRSIQESIPYLYDDPIIDLNKDRLNSMKIAGDIFKRIYGSRDIPENYAISIGIEGAQGAGKTSIVNLIKSEYLDLVHREVIYFDFNVWQHSGNLVESFLTEFNIFLKRNNIFGLSDYNRFKRYIKRIANVHPVLQILSGFIEEPTTQELFYEISNIMARSGKRVVVFMDDVDRLNEWDRWNQMFSLIRATANFSHVFYITCFSKQELVRIFPTRGDRKKDTAKEIDGYLEKIFNLIFPVECGIEIAANRDGRVMVIENFLKELFYEEILLISGKIFEDNDFKNNSESAYVALISKWESEATKKINGIKKIMFKVLKNIAIEQSFLAYMTTNVIDGFVNKLFLEPAVLKGSGSFEEIAGQPARTPRLIKCLVNEVLELLYANYGLEKLKQHFLNKLNQMHAYVVPLNEIRDAIDGGEVRGVIAHDENGWTIDAWWEDDKIGDQIKKIFVKYHIVREK